MLGDSDALRETVVETEALPDADDERIAVLETVIVAHSLALALVDALTNSLADDEMVASAVGAGDGDGDRESGGEFDGRGDALPLGALDAL
jgi:hypothetical protein